MTSDALQIVRLVFSQVWRLFTEWYVPGTNVTPAGWALFMLSFCLGIKIFKRLINDNVSFSSGRSRSED